MSDVATGPLWDATFRARLLRQGLSADEMAEAVEAAENAAAERDRYRAALEEAREQVALCAADTTAVELRQRVEFVRSVLDRHAEINAARQRPDQQVTDLISEVRHQLDDREGRPAGDLS